MNPDYAPHVVWAVIVLAIIAAVVATTFQKGRGGHGGPGAGAHGAVYDLLSQDKRNAIEMIVEDKAASRDPEHADDKPTTGKT